MIFSSLYNIAFINSPQTKKLLHYNLFPSITV